jgi:hypothetical protein
MTPQRCAAGCASRFAGRSTSIFDNLLFAHGEPLIGGGRAALRAFVAGG